MKIKARIYNLYDVIIIDFVSAYNKDVKAIYVNRFGEVDSCYIEHVTILDDSYIPQGGE